MKKLKPYFKKLDCGIYPFDVLFTVGSTEKEVINYLDKTYNYKLDEEETNALNLASKSGRSLMFKNQSMLLWVSSDYLPLIAHEVTHIVEFLMEIIKTPINENTSEPVAYLTEYIWKQIVEDHTKRLF